MSEIAVIMPFYADNELAVKWIDQAIQSVLAQTFTDWELIIVTDGSAQSVPLYDDERIRYLTHDRRRGPGAARNTGVAASKAEWIVALDADDKLPPDALQFMYNQRCLGGVVYGDIYWIGDQQGYHLLHEWTVEGLRALDGLLPVTALHSRQAWRAVGGWDEHLAGLEDVEYWIRLAEQGICGRRVDGVMLEYRKHGNGRTAGLTANDQRGMNAVHREIKDKHRAFFGGSMAKCATCPGGAPEVSPPAKEGAPAGTVELKYMGGMLGGFFTPGAPETGTRYKVEGRSDHIYVDPRDAEFLMALRGANGAEYVRIERGPAPVPPVLYDSPNSPEREADLSELSVKKIQAMVADAQFVPDLRVWLAIERASETPRSTVISLLEKRMSVLLDGVTTE